MWPWWSCVAALACVASIRGALTFPQAAASCPRADQQCVSILTCAEYQTRAAVLRRRPRPCGFSGLTARVCCSTAELVTSAPLTGTRPPLTGTRPPLTGTRPPLTGPRPPLSGTRPPLTGPRPPLTGPRPPLSGPRPPLPGQCGQPRAETGFIRFKRDTPRQVMTERLTEPARGGRQRRQLTTVDSDGLEPEFPPFVSAIGGVDAQLGKWPWMVLFGRWTEDGLGRWFCGGVLITDQHVLTAAHCLRPEEAGTVGARIGDNDLNRPDEVDHQQRNVSRIVRHPQYGGSQNDLAVVRLAAPVELTEAVQPICLPPAGAEHLGQDVEMAGWGLLEFAGEASDILQEVALRVTDPAACEAAYRRVPQFERRFPGGFQGTKVCAGSRDGEPRDACRGDSGGPLMVQLGDGTYQLVGIVSGGIGCGNPDFPGVYSKVSAYIDWIVSQLK